ncbi:MAG TPA: acetate--CoA ligase family protein [Ramlibacter sp.]|nr:acetate--CoA ligase family protein [Ramlibacter sp.]
MGDRVAAAELPRQSAYRHAELVPLVAPRSIAIAGISSREGSFGRTTLAALSGFDGPVYPVNPRYPEIAGHACYPSIAALPQVPDLVVLAAGLDSVEGLVRDCVAARVPSCLVYAAGYAETGKPERIELQSQLGAIARESGLRIAGPNCLGIVNYVRQSVVSFAPFPNAPRPGGRWIGIASQSGAMANSLSQMVEQGSPVGMALSAGNCCDVDAADLIAYLVEEPDCGVIVSAFEGVSSGPRLLDAMRRAWEADKPLVVYKMATGRQGAQAAASHTGSLAGSNAAYRAAFDRHGVVAVDNFESLVEAANFFLKARAPRGRGVAALNTSGGCTVMAADMAELHGVPLPQPAPAVQELVAQHIPDFGSARNPYDVTAQILTAPGSFPACAEALASDPAFSAVLMTTAWSSPSVAARTRVFAEAVARHGKMPCNVWISPWLDGPGARDQQQALDIALFRSMDRCFATLAAWHRRGDLRAAGERQLRRASPQDAIGPVRERITRAGTSSIGEREAKSLLAAYGLPVVPERLVQSADEAVAAASALGYPVVLKVESADLPHKTEAGVVRLRLAGEAEVREAHAEVMANAARASARVDGVLVQPMVTRGVEIVVGARIDPQFGALVVVGLGGVLVELLQDTAVALAPVTHDEALGLLARLKGQQVLDGFRGAPAVDRRALADVIVRAAEFAADHADGIEEMDINPLLCDGDRIAAVDALIVRAAPPTRSP